MLSKGNVIPVIFNKFVVKFICGTLESKRYWPIIFIDTTRHLAHNIPNIYFIDFIN